MRTRPGRLTANFLMVAMLAIAAPAGAQAQGAADLDALNKQVVQLLGQDNYKEATAIAEKALAVAERVLGPEHPDTLTNVNLLATLYQAQGRYSEADPLFMRVLADRERVLGPEHPATLASAASLARIFQDQGRYGEAEPLLKRVLTAQERALGPEHPYTLKKREQSGRPLSNPGPL